MMIPCEFGSFLPLWRAQGWVLERLISLNCVSGDLRWALVALAFRSSAAMWAFAQRLFALLVRQVARRSGMEVRFAADVDDADSMVAAGGS